MSLSTSASIIESVGVPVCRPSHLKTPGGPKTARAALSRRAIEGYVRLYSAKQGDACCYLAARRATYGPYRTPIDGPFQKWPVSNEKTCLPVSVSICFCFSKSGNISMRIASNTLQDVDRAEMSAH